MEQIVYNMNMLFEYFTFFYVIFHKRNRQPDRNRRIALAICLFAWIGLAIAGADLWTRTIGPFSASLLWIYIVLWCLLDVSAMEIVVLGIGQWLILSMLESALYIMLQPLRLGQSVLENIIMLVLSCSLWIYYISAGKKYDAYAFEGRLRIWCLLDAILVVLTAMISFFSYVIAQELSSSKTIFMGRVLSAVGGVIIVILLLIMMYFFNSVNNLRRQNELAEMQNKMQKEYFLKLLEREEETRKFRHDIINDLLEIHNYCENKNCKQMKQYLENTLGIVQKISKNSYDVGNDIVNTVINYYFGPLKEKCSIKINGYMSEKISIGDRDLCILFANLFKNASEAVGKMDGGKIWVKIEEGEKTLYIQVKNTYTGKVAIDKKGMPVTLKPDKRNHGIGTKTVADIVKRNGGKYNIEAAEGIYKIEIYLKI